MFNNNCKRHYAVIYFLMKNRLFFLKIMPLSICTFSFVQSDKKKKKRKKEGNKGTSLLTSIQIIVEI